jgi:hypothetical protein
MNPLYPSTSNLEVLTGSSAGGTQPCAKESSAKEPYHAPQIKIHGKLERTTLQAGSNGGGVLTPPEETCETNPDLC